jgi:hypothetical protein
MPVTTPASAKLFFPAVVDPTAKTIDRHATNTQAAAEAWYDHIMHVAGTAEKYDSVISTPSIVGYDAVVTIGTTKKGLSDAVVKAVQAGKSKAGFDKWLENVSKMGETIGGVAAKRLKDILEAKKENWKNAVAVYGFRATGETAGTKGVATAIAMLLSGDPRGPLLTSPGDDLVGMPYDINVAGMAGMFRAALMGSVIQCFVLGSIADWDTVVMDELNAKMVAAANAFRDAAKANEFTLAGTTPKSQILIFGGPAPYLEVICRLGST